MRVALGLLLIASACAIGLSGCGGDDEPRPDLAFVSTRDGPYAIYEMNADGNAQRRLTDTESDPSTPAGLFFQVEPSWSPDGKRIAFASGRSGNLDVFVMNADGTGTSKLTSEEGDDQHPTWSPDGRRIAFEHSDDIYVMSAQGAAARVISDPAAAESEPAWAPNGRWIAYVRRTLGTDAYELWITRPDGSAPRQVTALHARSVNPAWSPDSTRLAFASNALGPLYDIYTIVVGEKRIRRMTSAGPDAFEPAWSPDGSRIAFSQDGSIRTVDLELETDELTSPKNNDSSPVWNPRPPPAGD